MLDWPLQKGHCEVKLLNQIGDNDHHIERGVYQEKGHDKVISGSKVTCGERSNPFMWGSNQFISHDHLLKKLLHVSTSKMILYSFKLIIDYPRSVVINAYGVMQIARMSCTLLKNT